MVDAVATLQAGNVVHFDLKPQNIYLEPLPGTSDADFWAPPTETPTFRIVIGDFGESKMFPPDSSSYTLRPLGTDFMKSPEMLRNGQHTVLHQQRENFDRRRHKGAGPPSDVWALACVLYQLIFGEMLFFDPDYFRFLQRVGFGAGPAVQQPAAGKLSQTPAVARLVSLMTERNQEARIDLWKVQAKLELLVGAASPHTSGGNLLPPYKRPVPRAPGPSGPVYPSMHLPQAQPAELGRSAALVAAPGLSGSTWTACGDAVDAHVSGMMQLTAAVLLAPSSACRCVAELSATALQCIIVLSAATKHARGHNRKGHWMDLAAALEVPCMHFSQMAMSVEALEGLREDVGACDRVLVVWEPGVWENAAMVAVAVAMQKHDMQCCMALTRLRRCTLFGRLSREQVSILFSIRA